jgi:hypothetical protein
MAEILFSSGGKQGRELSGSLADEPACLESRAAAGLGQIALPPHVGGQAFEDERSAASGVASSLVSTVIPHCSSTASRTGSRVGVKTKDAGRSFSRPEWRQVRAGKKDASPGAYRFDERGVRGRHGR